MTCHFNLSFSRKGFHRPETNDYSRNERSGQTRIIWSHIFPSMANMEITSGGKERIPQVADLYKDAFRDDPVIRYFLCSLDTAQRHQYLYEYFTCLGTAAALNGGTFSEADDWKSAAIILPPGKSIDNPWTLVPAGLFQVLWKLGFAGCWRMLREYEPATAAVRQKAIGSKDFHYLFFVATRDDARGRGLSSALIKELQKKASMDGLPVWLEATTQSSARLYAKLGFENVGQVVLGESTAAPDGSREQGGSGVPVECMVWWPEDSRPAN